MVGFKWKKIAEAIPGRSGDAVRNRYQRLKAATADGLAAGDHLASSETHAGASPPPLSGCPSSLMPPPPRPAQSYAVGAFSAAADACRSSCEQRGVNAACSGNTSMGSVSSYTPVASAYVSTDTELRTPPLVAVATPSPASSANGFPHAAAASWTNLPVGFVQGKAGMQQAGLQQAAMQQAAMQQAAMQQAAMHQAALQQACGGAPLSARAIQPSGSRSATSAAAHFGSTPAANDPFAQMLATAVPSVLQPGVRFQPTGSIVSSLPNGFDCDSSYSSLESNSRSRSRSNVFEASR